MESKTESNGFHACGQYYRMGKPGVPYVEQIKMLLVEIRENYLKHKMNHDT
jgi:hypothetical protein